MPLGGIWRRAGTSDIEVDHAQAGMPYCPAGQYPRQRLLGLVCGHGAGTCLALSKGIMPRESLAADGDDRGDGNENRRQLPVRLHQV